MTIQPKAMPPWPALNVSSHAPTQRIYDCEYYKALAAAYEARARLMAGFIQTIANNDDFYNGYQERAQNMILDVGPLPPQSVA